MIRRNTPCVSFIGFGEAGQAIAAGLRDAGIERVVAWDILFPENAGAHLKAAGEAIGARMASSAGGAVREADIIISAGIGGCSGGGGRFRSHHISPKIRITLTSIQFRPAASRKLPNC